MGVWSSVLRVFRGVEEGDEVLRLFLTAENVKLSFD